ncbi:hypothetical protein FMM80_09030 [Schaedlerella arabinosiphila]|uniref:Uncharacterized protein n=1 Tax=Schaedlerella arabinosiphila TaxID=2044587 RepID=A0A9X5C9X3_9FIRM|nr:hypothetical protein [Schaedlerella arabinosiphila]
MPDKIKIPPTPLQSKIGACGVSLSGILKSGKAVLVSSPISHRDIAAGGYPVISGRGGLVLMVTYGDLFTFVIILCAVITLVIYIKRKK